MLHGEACLDSLWPSLASLNCASYPGERLLLSGICSLRPGYLIIGFLAHTRIQGIWS